MAVDSREAPWDPMALMGPIVAPHRNRGPIVADRGPCLVGGGGGLFTIRPDGVSK